jgi:hypothetical protein
MRIATFRESLGLTCAWTELFENLIFCSKQLSFFADIVLSGASFVERTVPLAPIARN